MFNNPVNLIDPLGLCALKTVAPIVGMISDAITGRNAIVYLLALVEQGTYNNWFTQGLAAGASTILMLADGLLSAPEAMLGQLGEFFVNPSLSTLPVLGPLGVVIGQSWAIAVEEPSFVNISRAVGHSLIGVATALGGLHRPGESAGQ